MGTSYIAKDKVYVVCTFQLNADPRKLSNTRETPTVFYGSDKSYPILTVNDKNINEQFTCKSPWNFAFALLAFGAGMIVGALLLSNPAGWILIAGGACLALGAAATIAAVTHKCTDPLSSGEWNLAHNSVKINGCAAITRSSILKRQRRHPHPVFQLFCRLSGS